MMAIRQIEVWNEVDEFLTSTPTPEQIIAFRPSQPAQERLRSLLEANQNGTLTPDESMELDATMGVENFMRRLKIKALAKTIA